MIHYIYKIIFLRGYPTGRYYLGKRSYHGIDIRKDKYTGSGSFPKAYFKAYGKKEGDTYLKEIIEINPSVKINRDREGLIIGDKWKTDPLCMNLRPGGGGFDKIICGKRVLQYDYEGNLISIHKTVSAAAEAVGLTAATPISNCCLGKGITAGGYIWRYLDSPLTKAELSEIEIKHKPVDQYSSDGNFIKTWPTVMDASKALSISSCSISDICRHVNQNRHTAGGYLWSYHGTPPLINKKKKTFVWKRKVCQFDRDGNLIAIHNSLKDAAKAVGATWQTIQRCCNGKRATTHGYLWAFEGKKPSNKAFLRAKKNNTVIQQIDKNGKIIRTYSKLWEASEKTGFSVTSIQYASQHEKWSCGYLWKRVSAN